MRGLQLNNSRWSVSIAVVVSIETSVRNVTMIRTLSVESTIVHGKHINSSRIKFEPGATVVGTAAVERILQSCPHQLAFSLRW